MNLFRSALAVLLLLVAPAFAAAAGMAQAPKEQLTVFAAASLQGSLDDVAAEWTRVSGQHVVISYAGSSALARQIEQGAPAQVFISADQAWMDYLGERRLIDPASRFDVVGNRLVLIANARNAMPAMTVESALPLMLGPDGGRLAIANVDVVPAGRYAKQALIALGRWDAVADRLAMADDVRAAMAFVARGEAPLGIVYATDAKVEPNVRVIATIPTELHASIVYPAARIAGIDADHADGFLAFLRSDLAICVFARAGFVVATNAQEVGASADLGELFATGEDQRVISTGCKDNCPPPRCDPASAPPAH